MFDNSKTVNLKIGKNKRQESPPLVFCNMFVTVIVTPGLCGLFFFILFYFFESVPVKY